MDQQQTARCSKCNSEMDEGFVADFAHSQIVQEQWVQGSPEQSFWTGTKVRDKPRFRIVTFRCPTCGYLESYALEPIV
jgi:predicted RNA-binding Zn-ribbon protein involved in translation (DUF1610 family)